jgi:hypothetical protein
MSCIVFGGRPRFLGAGLGLIVAKDATIKRKISDIYLPMFILRV